jgi:hypothetical protein
MPPFADGGLAVHELDDRGGHTGNYSARHYPHASAQHGSFVTGLTDRAFNRLLATSIASTFRPTVGGADGVESNSPPKRQFVAAHNRQPHVFLSKVSLLI